MTAPSVDIRLPDRSLSSCDWPQLSKKALRSVFLARRSVRDPTSARCRYRRASATGQGAVVSSTDRGLPMRFFLASAAARRSRRGDALRILFIETRIACAKRYACLRAEGHEVVSASTGSDGLRIALEQGFDVVVCDILLPHVNGFQICARLRESGSGRQSSCSQRRTVSGTRLRHSTPARTTTSPNPSHM